MGKVVFITGVSSGIGAALAEWHLNEGDRVFGVSRRTPESLLAKPGFAFASLDLSRLDEIAPAIGNLLAGTGRVDTAVLNAGVLGEIGDMSETSLETMRHVMDVNLWANKAVLDALFADNREVTQVAAISSGAAVGGARGWNAYAISKAALNTMIALYAAERPETHFSALAPGLADTAMQERMRGLPRDPRFPTMERLRRAAGTKDMPNPESLAPRLAQAVSRLRAGKSGGFHDLRALE